MDEFVRTRERIRKDHLVNIMTDENNEITAVYEQIGHNKFIRKSQQEFLSQQIQD